MKFRLPTPASREPHHQHRSSSSDSSPESASTGSTRSTVTSETESHQLPSSRGRRRRHEAPHDPSTTLFIVAPGAVSEKIRSPKRSEFAAGEKLLPLEGSATPSAPPSSFSFSTPPQLSSGAVHRGAIQNPPTFHASDNPPCESRHGRVPGGWWLSFKSEWWFLARRYYYPVSVAARVICTMAFVALCCVVGTLHIPILSTLESIENIVVPEYQSIVFTQQEGTTSTGTAMALPLRLGSIVTRLPSGELSPNSLFHVEASRMNSIENASSSSLTTNSMAFLSSSQSVTPAVCGAEVTETILEELRAVGIVAASGDDRATPTVVNSPLLGAIQVETSGVLVLPIRGPATTPGMNVTLGWLVGCRCILRSAVTGLTFTASDGPMAQLPPSLRYVDQRVSLNVVTTLNDTTSLSGSAWIPIDTVLSAEVFVAPHVHNGTSSIHAALNTTTEPHFLRVQALVLGTNRTQNCIRCYVDSEDIVAVQIRATVAVDGFSGRMVLDSAVTLEAVGSSVTPSGNHVPQPRGTWTSATIAWIPTSGINASSGSNATSLSLGFAVFSSVSGDIAVCHVYVPIDANTTQFTSWSYQADDAPPPLRPAVIVLLRTARAESFCGAPLQVSLASASPLYYGNVSEPWEVTMLLASTLNTRSCASTSLLTADPVYVGPGASSATPTTDAVEQASYCRFTSVMRYSVADGKFSVVMPVSAATPAEGNASHVAELVDRIALAALPTARRGERSLLSADAGGVDAPDISYVSFVVPTATPSDPFTVNWILRLTEIRHVASMTVVEEVSFVQLQWVGGYEVAGIVVTPPQAASSVTSSDFDTVSIPQLDATATLVSVEVAVRGRVLVMSVVDAAVVPLLPAVASSYPSLSWDSLAAWVGWTSEQRYLISKRVNIAAAKGMEICVGPLSRGFTLRQAPYPQTRAGRGLQATANCFAMMYSNRHILLL